MVNYDQQLIFPISTTKLFHAKAYALINCDNKIEQQYQGFGIVTSANLTNGGIHNNIEIGHVFDDNDSLKDLYNLFIDLKDNYLYNIIYNMQKDSYSLEAEDEFFEKIPVKNED